MEFLGDISQKDCLSRFVRYETTGDVRHVMTGLAGTEPRTVHLSHGHNRFETTATPVPAGYRKNTRYDKRWAHEYHCRDPNPVPTRGKDVELWVHEARDKYLTIGDVRRLRPGQRLSLTILDRNLIDTLSEVTPNKPMKATALLAPTRATYIHESGLRGKLVMANGVELDPFEFHVQVPNGWYPLRNGVLPAKDPQGFMKLYGKPVRSQDMPPNTHIGYRGPVIPWSVVTKAPQMYWYQE